MSAPGVYDQFAGEYDEWFDRHHTFYQSELLALRELVPASGRGIEIGAGTGRFATPLLIPIGVEPSENMAAIARARGMEIMVAKAEQLPLAAESFDFVLMVTAVCFLENIPKAFSEVHRILKPGGAFIIGLIDRETPLGRQYETQQATNKFYRDAHFHSTGEITRLLEDAGFANFSYRQTIFESLEKQIDSPKPGYGQGSFVVIRAMKSPQ